MSDGNLRYFIGTKKSREQARKKAKDNLLETIKSSIFCSLRGTIIFFIGFTSLVHSAIVKDEERKRRSLYAMYRNIIPFLEVCAMATTMSLLCSKMHGKTLFFFFPCLLVGFLVCFSLRMFGVREDCCKDMDYSKFFNEEGKFQGISFNIPKCKGKNENIPKYFLVEGGRLGNHDNSIINNKSKYIFYPLYSILYIPLFLINTLDLFFKGLIDLCTKREFNDSTKSLATTDIPSTFHMMFFSVPCCEKKVGRSLYKITHEQVEPNQIGRSL